MKKPVRSTNGIGPRDQATHLLIQARFRVRLSGDHGEVPLRSAWDAIDHLTHAIAYLSNPRNEGVA